MITDQPNTGDGDIRSGGRNAPTTPAPVAPVKLSREARLLLHVQTAARMGLSLEDALAGTGVSARQVRRWAAGPAGDEAHDELKRRRLAKEPR